MLLLFTLQIEFVPLMGREPAVGCKNSLLIQFLLFDNLEKLLRVDTAALGTGVLFLPWSIGSATEVNQGLQGVAVKNGPTALV